MLISFSFTFFAFGEESIMIRNMGFSTITISGLLAGCLSSSVLITGELEKQATLAILCKPITRTQYILGKYLGILSAATLMVVSQSIVLETGLVIKQYMDIPNYTTNTTSLIDFICLLGICFALLQIVVLTSISLVLSLFLNTIANITICILFFIFCNTYGSVLSLYESANGSVSSIASICYTIFPNLQNLNVLLLNQNAINQTALWQEHQVVHYIVYNIIYYTIYSTAMICLSVLIFRRKEI